jgi:protein-tyrosine phosphatase
MIRVLFVCLGNICRSPMAAGAFRRLAEEAGLAGQIVIDAAGTHDYQIGSPPDARAQAAAARRGIDISAFRGRQVAVEDFYRFDYLLAMDRQNAANLRAICPGGHEHKVRLLLEFARGRPEREIPDPYSGPDGLFDSVFEMIEEAAQGLLEEVRRRLGTTRSLSSPASCRESR